MKKGYKYRVLTRQNSSIHKPPYVWSDKTIDYYTISYYAIRWESYQLYGFVRKVCGESGRPVHGSCWEKKVITLQVIFLCLVVDTSGMFLFYVRQFSLRIYRNVILGVCLFYVISKFVYNT